MNPSPLPRVTVVIPTFNKWELTKQCLEALRGSSLIDFEIVLVDNASSDRTYHHVLTEFPEVHAIKNRENKNFSGACNQGAVAAQGEYIVFLNNDMIPFTGWLEPLVRELDEHPEVAIVGSKLIFPDNTLQHAGVAFMRETRFPYHPYRSFPADMPEANHRRELQVVTGACLAIRRKVFFTAGMFNDEYRNGGEDIELCLKVRDLGHKVVYQPESVLIHLESQSPGRMDFNEQNVEVFFKNFPDHLLSDEDAFYFEDGFFRLQRLSLEKTEVKKFIDSTHAKQYLHVADLQLAFANRRDIGSILSDVPIEDWPVDEGMHEWVALVAHKAGYYKSAANHFKEAMLIHKLLTRNRALGEINSSVLLNPHFNKYFAGK